MADIDPETAELARRGVERITTAGDRGATQITAEEAKAMAATILGLIGYIQRLDPEIGYEPERKAT